METILNESKIGHETSILNDSKRYSKADYRSKIGPYASAMFELIR